MAGLVLAPAAWGAWTLTADLRAAVPAAAYAALAGLALLTLHYMLVNAEDRGWIYYRQRRGSYGGLGTTTDWLNMYDPSRQYVQEVARRQEWQRDEDDDGDGRDDLPGEPDGFNGKTTRNLGAGRNH
jgi:hypothetical protein